jgi:hypothetical protein
MIYNSGDNYMSPTSEYIIERQYLREPVPEIYDAARYLDAATSAHLQGKSSIVEDLLRLADMPVIREWTESLWGKKSPYVLFRPMKDSPPDFTKELKIKERMPTTTEKKQLLLRDGYHCRFCGIPVIRMEIRERFKKLYPHLMLWGNKNIDQHAAFQAMWVQYDHILPHSRGGHSGIENMLITCAPCNYGRMQFTLDEVGLSDPRLREPVKSTWDGLERLI